MLKNNAFRRLVQIKSRSFSTNYVLNNCKKALLLGVNTPKKTEKNSENEDKLPIEGSQLFSSFDKECNSKLSNLLGGLPQLKTGQTRTFYGLSEEFRSVTVMGMGPKDSGLNSLERINEAKENTRKAIGAGMQSLKGMEFSEAIVDVPSNGHASAEGAFLSTWAYKKSDREKFPTTIQPYQNDDQTQEGWKSGKIYAESQNFARFLMESPANLMTPTKFSEHISDKFKNCGCKGKLSVHIRDQTWIENEGMGAFMSVTRGSEEPPKFVEIHYTSPDREGTSPLVLVGKGVTFDSGGVSLKPPKAMDEMRADMGGAATVAAAVLAAATSNMSANVIGLIPLCENMINGKATKPGDVVTARNGQTIQVDNTDAEGRLLLADALLYAQDFNPSAVVNAATLTGGMVVALGCAVTGVFCNNDQLWDTLHKGGIETGDRLWRMPLLDFYSDQVKPADLADINNVGRASGGQACTAAAFLRHFVKEDTKWAHFDIAGVMKNTTKDVTYLCSGMAGRPTRTFIEFIKNYEY